MDFLKKLVRKNRNYTLPLYLGIVEKLENYNRWDPSTFSKARVVVWVPQLRRRLKVPLPREYTYPFITKNMFTVSKTHWTVCPVHGQEDITGTAAVTNNESGASSNFGEATYSLPPDDIYKDANELVGRRVVVAFQYDPFIVGVI